MAQKNVSCIKKYITSGFSCDPSKHLNGKRQDRADMATIRLLCRDLSLSNIVNSCEDTTGVDACNYMDPLLRRCDATGRVNDVFVGSTHSTAATPPDISKHIFTLPGSAKANRTTDSERKR